MKKTTGVTTLSGGFSLGSVGPGSVGPSVCSVGPRLNLFPVRDHVQWVPVLSERPRSGRSDHTPSSWVPTWRDPGVRGVLKTTAKTVQKRTPPHFFFSSWRACEMVGELFILPREFLMVSGALAARLWRGMWPQAVEPNLSEMIRVRLPVRSIRDIFRCSVGVCACKQFMYRYRASG